MRKKTFLFLLVIFGCLLASVASQVLGTTVISKYGFDFVFILWVLWLLLSFRTGLEKKVAVVLGLLFFVTGLYFVSDAPLKFFITEVRPVVFLSLAALVVSAQPINRLFKNKGNIGFLLLCFFYRFSRPIFIWLTVTMNEKTCFYGENRISN